jgi:pyrroline-5-carboxylate reductase
MHEQIGIIGLGHPAGFLVEGLRKAAPDLPILLADRDPERAEGLGSRWGAHVLRSNQALADASDLIILALLPEDVVPACEAVIFRPGQVVASTAAKVPLARIAAAVAPASAVRVMPISSAMLIASPTLLYPFHPGVCALFSRLGQVHAMPDEASFISASVVTAFHGWIATLVADTVAWANRAGVPSDTARSLVLETVRSVVDTALAQPDLQFADLLHESAAPGGTSAQGLGVLQERRVLASWTEALDVVLESMRLPP